MKKSKLKVMDIVSKELGSKKKKIFLVSWVNRKNESNSAYVRIAGFAYDSDGHPIVVVRSVDNKNMLFNLRLSRIYNMKPIYSKKQKVRGF